MGDKFFLKIGHLFILRSCWKGTSENVLHANGVPVSLGHTLTLWASKDAVLPPSHWSSLAMGWMALWVCWKGLYKIAVLSSWCHSLWALVCWVRTVATQTRLLPKSIVFHPSGNCFPILVTHQRHHCTDKHWSQPGMLAPPFTVCVTYAKSANFLGTQRSMVMVMRWLKWNRIACKLLSQCS